MAIQPIQLQLNQLYTDPLETSAAIENNISRLKRNQTIALIATAILAAPVIAYASMVAVWWIAPVASALTVWFMQYRVHASWEPSIQQAQESLGIAQRYDALDENLDANNRRIQAHILWAKEKFEKSREAYKQELDTTRQLTTLYREPGQLNPEAYDRLLQSKNILHLSQQHLCSEFLYLAYLHYLKNNPYCPDSFEEICTIRGTNNYEEYQRLKEVYQHQNETLPFVIFKNGRSLSLEETFNRALRRNVHATLHNFITPADPQPAVNDLLARVENLAQRFA